MTRTISRPAGAVLSSFVGVTGVVLLSGCSATPVTQVEPSSAPVAGEARYADGTYSADGSYSPQAGLIETVTVTVTLSDDVITDVSVVGAPQKAESKQYQSLFIGGISDEVVGKSIDEINVSRVAGSSLTSGGFNKAIDEIKAEAAA